MQNSTSDRYCLKTDDGRFATMHGSQPNLTEIKALRYSWKHSEDAIKGFTAQERAKAWSKEVNEELTVCEDEPQSIGRFNVAVR